jgi:hypothetical protein
MAIPMHGRSIGSPANKNNSQLLGVPSEGVRGAYEPGSFLLLIFGANICHFLKLRNRKFQGEIKDTLYFYEDFG